MPTKKHSKPRLVRRKDNALKKSTKKAPTQLPDTSRIPWFPTMKTGTDS